MFRWVSLGLLATAQADFASYATALNALNWTAVDEAIIKVLTTSNDTFWPADYGHYGPFMIRLGWHCAGSYRKQDGRGGCDGGRIRFSPESVWDDNANLNKARTLLEPIKTQFGAGLSYGDLYIRTATVAIKHMNGPVLGFCAGRYDDADGSESTLLGPTPGQESTFNCATQGDCKATEGLGPTTIGLIYVNPGGPQGNGDRNGSAPQIRDTFDRMDMNDRETVALIGGGHAFGKSHGACPAGPGPKPEWTGTCNENGQNGKGYDTSTSGFEGPWTSNPILWSNEYFTNLLNFAPWERINGSGGNFQYRNTTTPPALALNATGPTEEIMMLNADVSLLTDANYTALVSEYAGALATLNTEFSNAWYKLTTRDVGPRTRCFAAGGKYGWIVPSGQAWQHDLPAPNVAANFTAVKDDLKTLVAPNPFPFAMLAWQCASTYRRTDYRGGCNGARIQFAPENQWPANVALGTTALIGNFTALRAKYPSLSLADAITFAGHVAIEQLAGVQFDFCAGRSDATEGSGSVGLEPMNWTNKSAEFREKANRLGLTLGELVVLQGLPRPAERTGWTSSTTSIGTGVFGELAGTAATTNPYDLAIRADPELKGLATGFSNDANSIKTTLFAAWTKLMNNDLFLGWNNRTCPKLVPVGGAPGYSAAASPAAGLASILALAGMIAFA